MRGCDRRAHEGGECPASFATAYVSTTAALLRCCARTFHKGRHHRATDRPQSSATLAITGARNNILRLGAEPPAGPLWRSRSSPPRPGTAAGSAVLGQDVALVNTVLAVPDPREDSRDAATLWPVAGGAALLLFQLFGEVVSRTQAGPTDS